MTHNKMDFIWMNYSFSQMHESLTYTHHSINAVISIYRAHTVSQAGSGGPMPPRFD